MDESVSNIPVCQFYPKIHLVYDTSNQTFIKTIDILPTLSSNRIRVIYKDAFGPDIPNRDFYITGGHRVFIDGKNIKVRHLQQSKKPRSKKILRCTLSYTRPLTNFN